MILLISRLLCVRKQNKTVNRSQQALTVTSLKHVVLIRPFDFNPRVVFSVPSLTSSVLLFFFEEAR